MKTRFHFLQLFSHALASLARGREVVRFSGFARKTNHFSLFYGRREVWTK
ncbi:MAG: hypothetical protein U5L45_04830 [Saprospiraceae bacterium]|nr:hypothetical protein [Saprospiraceae bacterium]